MSVLKRLSAVIERRGKESGKFLAGPLPAACCFALIEVRIYGSSGGDCAFEAAVRDGFCFFSVGRSDAEYRTTV